VSVADPAVSTENFMFDDLGLGVKVIVNVYGLVTNKVFLFGQKYSSDKTTPSLQVAVT